MELNWFPATCNYAPPHQVLPSLASKVSGKNSNGIKMFTISMHMCAASPMSLLVKSMVNIVTTTLKWLPGTCTSPFTSNSPSKIPTKYSEMVAC